MPWSTPFDDPVPLPNGRQLPTLNEAADYIQRLPKAEQKVEQWQTAIHCLIGAAEGRGLLDACSDSSPSTLTMKYQQLRVDLAAFRASSKMAFVGTVSANRLWPSRRQLESKPDASKEAPMAAIAAKLGPSGSQIQAGFFLTWLRSAGLDRSPDPPHTSPRQEQTRPQRAPQR
jgi:hypothetical protein